MDYTVAEAFSWFISLTWWHAALLVFGIKLIGSLIAGAMIGVYSALTD